MKKFILIICLISYRFIFSQELEYSNIKCNYLTTFLTDTTNINTKKEELTGLWIGKNSSLFKSDQKAKYDSLTKESTKKSMLNPINGKIIIDFSKIPRAFFKPEVYKEGNSVKIFDKIMGTNYEYESDQKINWTLVDETKIISTYKFRKAIGKYRNKNITAWYTEEVPISEGPYTFKGLPGLVVEAYDDKDFFHFTLIKLKNQSELIAPIRNIISTDYQKFLKKRIEFQNDPSGAYFMATGKTVPKDDVDRVTKMHRTNNNHLD
ncbi:GLPGLI family protein [Chryseobacterium ginsenosidimutans]|uniref:GLPGLI family protein n=1 Tax=Chryseobacterium ginsenosidimutans TaxID=687846 RepID=UPI002784D7DA|nr:GLPGLI family protein [Chryseobacterium ginsenosidimutans]MDQ0593303.1 GLPGLI family protein [Chryseobacterium ginsenosidimutans]